jgi:hypothetical protein
MDRLINAILRLSREGRRPITSERLDMRDLLVSGVATALKHRIDELGRASSSIADARYLQRPAGDRADLLQPGRERDQISPAWPSRPDRDQRAMDKGRV